MLALSWVISCSAFLWFLLEASSTYSLSLDVLLACSYLSTLSCCSYYCLSLAMLSFESCLSLSNLAASALPLSSAVALYCLNSSSRILYLSTASLASFWASMRLSNRLLLLRGGLWLCSFCNLTSLSSSSQAFHLPLILASLRLCSYRLSLSSLFSVCSASTCFDGFCLLGFLLGLFSENCRMALFGDCVKVCRSVAYSAGSCPEQLCRRHSRCYEALPLFRRENTTCRDCCFRILTELFI
jgi:hypothetical protein